LQVFHDLAFDVVGGGVAIIREPTKDRRGGQGQTRDADGSNGRWGVSDPRKEPL
jgi:hypothetical protein